MIAESKIGLKMMGENKLLTKNGFKTMPSCEGHNRSDKFIEDAYDNLVSDAKKIKTTGL